MRDIVFEKGMEKILEENEELKKQNRELQKRNTELVEENRKLRNPNVTSVNIGGGGVVRGGHQPTESLDPNKPPRRDREECTDPYITNPFDARFNDYEIKLRKREENDD